MRQALFAFAFVLACAAPPLPALADPLDSQPDELLACVNAGRASREALNQCVGTQAQSCIENEGASYIADTLCWDAEAETWRGVIAQATLALSAHAPYRSATRLDAANAAWFAWAEAECEYLSWEEGGGSGEQVQRVRCAANLHAERAISLIMASQTD